MPHTVFEYPLSASRRHAPDGYTNYQEFKPWLRDEFAFRCVYCLERERWYPDGEASFSADHIYPKSTMPGLSTKYLNLVYCCTRCNSSKAIKIFVNPSTSPLGHHLRMLPSGELEAITSDGQDLIDFLHLNEKAALTTRKKYLAIASLKDRNPACTAAAYLFDLAR